MRLFKGPLSAAVASQLLALLILLSAVRVFDGFSLATWQLLLAQGVLAAIISRPFGMANWWLLLHLLFPLLLWLAMSWQIPSWIYLVAFIVTLLVFWNSAGERVPLYLSNQTTWQALSNLLPAQDSFRFVDLGSGLAGTLNYLAQQHPEGEFVGVESAPLPMLLARLRCKKQHNITLLQQDMWSLNLARFDVVYCFLSPEPMPKIYVKARKEMRPGSLLISNSFTVQGREPDQVLELDDRRRTRLYLWRM